DVLGQARNPAHYCYFVCSLLTTSKPVSQGNQRNSNGRKVDPFPGNGGKVTNIDSGMQNLFVGAKKRGQKVCCRLKIFRVLFSKAGCDPLVKGRPLPSRKKIGVPVQFIEVFQEDF